MMIEHHLKFGTIKSSALSICVRNPILLTDAEAMFFCVIIFGVSIIYAYLKVSYVLDRRGDLLKRKENGVGELEELVAMLLKTKGKLEIDVYPLNNDLVDISIRLKNDQQHA